jgi:hypothetical protein
VGVVVLEAFAGITCVLPDHISLGRSALRGSGICFDVTREEGGEVVTSVVVVAACVVCYPVSAIAGGFLSRFIALMYLGSALAISGRPNRVSIVTSCVVLRCVSSFLWVG